MPKRKIAAVTEEEKCLVILCVEETEVCIERSDRKKNETYNVLLAKYRGFLKFKSLTASA
jgi:hypothetical protein